MGKYKLYNLRKAANNNTQSGQNLTSQIFTT